MARLFFLFLAAVCFLLACVGIVIPGLPTTPFLLLTSYFLVRSFPQLNSRLLKSRLFGPILIDWQVHGGIRNHVKVKAVSAVLLAVSLTMYFSEFTWQSVTAGLLAGIGIAVIVWIPVVDRGDPVQPD